MRVTGKTGTSGVGATRGVGQTSASGGAAPAAGISGVNQGSDALSVSGTAQFIAVARAHIAGIPDIRHAKVDAIKTKMDADSYHPDGEAVADGLVKEHLTRRNGP